ncbi:MAG: DUF3806 domain-containing protein [Pirellulales bacterium]|nr:DUF3806 domain-containing protein [Pirellulales bacterium]
MKICTLTSTLLIMGFLSLLGCSKLNDAPQEQQKVSALSQADVERLDKQRAIITQFVADEDSRAKYQKVAGKLGTLQAILNQKEFQPSQTYELQCMGAVLGDAFVQEMGMEWVMVEDEHGTDPAVRLPGTTIIIFPLTMISKRVERGETFDVFDLFNGIADKIDQLKKTADKTK